MGAQIVKAEISRWAVVAPRADFHLGAGWPVGWQQLLPVLAPFAHPQAHLPKIDLPPQIYDLGLIGGLRRETPAVDFHLGKGRARDDGVAVQGKAVGDGDEAEKAEVLGGKRDCGHRVGVALFVGEGDGQRTARPVAPPDKPALCLLLQDAGLGFGGRQTIGLEDVIGPERLVAFGADAFGREKDKALYRHLDAQVYGIENLLLISPLHVRGQVAIDEEKNFRGLV